MVHLTLNGTPICQQGHDQCQFSTRREAFDHLLRINGPVEIVLGPCPYTPKKEG